PQPTSPLFPYTTLFRSWVTHPSLTGPCRPRRSYTLRFTAAKALPMASSPRPLRRSDLSSLLSVLVTAEPTPVNLTVGRPGRYLRSEEHTSELQSRGHLV